jgi:hypothetical protein
MLGSLQGKFMTILSELIKNREWNKILEVYNVNEMTTLLVFKEGIILAYQMLHNEKWDEKVQNYAVDLLYAIRERYKEEWNSSWTYDAFLGNACHITLRYDERDEAYKRASEKIYPIPPSLMVLLARCYISPGVPPTSQEEAENLLREALKREKTIEGVSLIKRICERKKDMSQVTYWDKILKEVQEKNAHIHDTQPSFLKDRNER